MDESDVKNNKKDCLLEAITLTIRVPFSVTETLERLRNANMGLALEVVHADVGKVEIMTSSSDATGVGLQYKLVADAIKWLTCRSYTVSGPIRAVLKRMPATVMQMETHLNARDVQSNICCIGPM